MYIVAVALQDGAWHHERSYAPERANRADTVALWRKITTEEVPAWTARYHTDDPAQKAFGGRIAITMDDGREIAGEKAVANAHPLGATPWTRPDYVRKFRTLAYGLLHADEADRFLATVDRLGSLTHAELAELNVVVDNLPVGRGGIF